MKHFAKHSDVVIPEGAKKLRRHDYRRDGGDTVETTWITKVIDSPKSVKTHLMTVFENYVKEGNSNQWKDDGASVYTTVCTENKYYCFGGHLNGEWLTSEQAEKNDYIAFNCSAERHRKLKCMSRVYLHMTYVKEKGN